MRPSDMPADELEVLQRATDIQLVDTYDASVGVLGHSYFYGSPAVSSDLLLVLRDGRKPGAEYGRPLKRQADGFWRLERDYPTSGSREQGPK